MKHECGVCWSVYDSEVGDQVAQVPPGTPFEALPEDWRCPRCDGPREKYLLVSEEPTANDGRAALPALAAPRPAPSAEPRVGALVAEYRHIAETRMKGLPIVNPRLEVEAVDFQETPAGLVGALVTPWSINAVLFPVSGVAPVDGHQRVLPGGTYRFLPQRLERVAYVELTSLFSPVFQFEAQEAAVAAARAALAPLVTAPQPRPAAQEARAEEAPSSSGPARSRRELLRGLGLRGKS